MTPLSGCCSAEVACRRACRSPFFASVISFSSSGLTALALACVVLIRSWSITSTHRFASIALRCEASRESLWRGVLWGVSAPGPLRSGGAAAARAVVERGHAARAGAQLLDPVLVGEDRERGDQDLGGLAQRGRGVDRAVGLDVQRQLVEVGALADAGLLDRVRDALDGREDRVDRDHADRLVRRLVVLRRAVAAAATDREVQLELRLLLERRDVRVGVEDLDAGRQVDVARRDLAGPGHDQRRLDLGRVGVHPADDALEVQDDVGDVLGDALDRRELVRDPLDAHARDRRPRERGQQDAPQRVAEGVAEAAIEGLDRERAAVLLDRLTGDPGDLEVEHEGPCWVVQAVRTGRFAHGSGERSSYFEYSSTINCSWTGAAIS